MDLPSPRHVIRLGAAFLLVALPATALISCSAERSKTENTISPYDPEFDPEPAEGSSGEADLGEDELLERAKSAYDRGLYTVARENWTKLREQYPSSYYATLSELKIGDAYFFAGDYPAAVTSYEEFLKLHPAHDATPYVIYQIGNAHRAQYSGVKHDQAPLVAAVKQYRRILDEHPRSEYALSARRAVALCRELLAEHEASISRFYAKQGQEKATAKRLKDLIALYPETSAATWARSELGILEDEGVVSRGGSVKSAKNGAPPARPQMLVGLSEDTGNEGRFRMSKSEEIFEDDISTTAKPKVEQPKSFSPLLFVSCVEQDGMIIFSASFREPMRISIPDGTDARTAVLQSSRAAAPSAAEKSEALKSCELGGVELRFFSTKQGERTLIAELEGAPKKPAHFFTLDRPDRVVVIVEN